MIYRLIIYILLFPSLLFGQEKLQLNTDSGSSNNIGDCVGAIRIEPNVSSNVQLTGNGGERDDFVNIPELFPDKESNSLWFSCETKMPGYLSITLEKVDFFFNYAAFLMDNGAGCESILNGSIAPIQKGEVNRKNILTFLLDSVKVEANQSLIICINAQLLTQSNFKLISSFGDQITEKDIEAMKKSYDLREDDSERPFKIGIRDARTNLPVIANVIVSGLRKNNALYMTSDFVFSLDQPSKFNLKIDATGYFFEDREINLRQIDTNELIVFLEPVALNQSIELEGLEFVSQSDILLPTAYVKLKRLKDFMAINSKVEIEVQGHVHQNGKNTWRAKRLSKKRAKKVRAYLIDAGISKHRIGVVGFGNTKMKYPEAKSDLEIQANRRVEIRIR